MMSETKTNDLKQVEIRKDGLLRDMREVITFEVQPSSSDTGLVDGYSDGVATVTGLANAAMGQTVSFVRKKETVGEGFVFDLDEEHANCLVITGDIMPGDEALVNARADRGFEVSVGDQLLHGSEPNVISPTGSNLWTGELVATNHKLPLERMEAPGILKRAAIDPESDQIKNVIDNKDLPIHHGQRMLFLGDKESGKTTLMLDVLRSIASQPEERETIFVYAVISKESGQIRHIQRSLAAIESFASSTQRSVIVATRSSDPASLHYIAPYAATSIAEYWAELGKKVIVVYDDLTQHAAAYRQIALLLQHSPGREAYPGDVFYLHSRLLERCAKLNNGGSITGFPILETIEGDYIGYLPTNAISISDGQIVLSTEIKYRGDDRYGIDLSHSVSRIKR